MAAIDIIAKMSNGELIDYYFYCMRRQISNFTHRETVYVDHSSFPRITVYVERLKENPIYSLHTSNEMYLLKQMMKRYEEAESFAQKCWWQSHWERIFSVEVSWWKPEDGLVQEHKESVKGIDPIKHNGKTYQFLAAGLKRRVFVSDDRTHVIKVPKNDLGTVENDRELSTYQMHKNDPECHYAKCERLEGDMILMEYVEPMLKEPEDCPNWVYDIPDGQVGHNLAGKLVAYDYGSDA